MLARVLKCARDALWRMFSVPCAMQGSRAVQARFCKPRQAFCSECRVCQHVLSLLIDDGHGQEACFGFCMWLFWCFVVKTSRKCYCCAR